jgi:tripartite ATP-independent transporter DctP family solute receptor
VRNWFTGVLTIICLLVLVGTTVLAEDPIVLKYGHILGSETKENKATLLAGELIEQRSGGKLKLEVYPGGQLGAQFDEIENVKLGLQDMTMAQGIDRYCPNFSLFNLPFTYRDEQHAYKAYYLSEISEKYIKKYMLENHGIRIIGMVFRGARMLTTSEANPVKHPEDVKGLKLRTPDITAWIKGWQSIGANVTAFPWGELYLALKQGIVEAQENPLSSIRDMKFYEVQKNIILTEHIIDWCFVMINEKKFQSLGKELQDILVRSLEDARLYSYGRGKEVEAENITFFKEQGLNIVEIDKAEWLEAFSKAPEMFEGGREMYNKIQLIK